MAENCNNENQNTMKPIPFVVYGYPMYGMYPGMMPGNMGGMNMGACGNYMNPVYYTPYNTRNGCCIPTDLDK